MKLPQFQQLTTGIPDMPCPRGGHLTDRRAVTPKPGMVLVEALVCSRCLGMWADKPPLLVPEPGFKGGRNG